MEKVVVKPKCNSCQEGALEVDKVIIDFTTCEYQVDSYCLACGEPNRCVLAMEDFIELNSMLIKKKGQDLVVGTPEPFEVYRGNDMNQLKGLSDYLKDEPVNDWKVLIFFKERKLLK